MQYQQSRMYVYLRHHSNAEQFHQILMCRLVCLSLCLSVQICQELSSQHVLAFDCNGIFLWLYKIIMPEMKCLMLL